MYLYHLDLFPRAEACWGKMGCLACTMPLSSAKFLRGAQIYRLFFSNELLLCHLPTPFLKPTWHITVGRTSALLFLLNILLD